MVKYDDLSFLFVLRFFLCVKFLPVSDSRREKTRLELLQQEQKVIEERNRRKKALLAKTIAEK